MSKGSHLTYSHWRGSFVCVPVDDDVLASSIEALSSPVVRVENWYWSITADQNQVCGLLTGGNQLEPNGFRRLSKRLVGQAIIFLSFFFFFLMRIISWPKAIEEHKEEDIFFPDGSCTAISLISAWVSVIMLLLTSSAWHERPQF